jgi:molybdopterin-guanine dinucleotide biosynthesis protein
MSNNVENIFPAKNKSRLRIYAYRIFDEHHKGALKIGQTTQDVKARVAQQLKTAAIKNYEILVDESAERPDGTNFRDFDVRARLKAKGFDSVELEWMVCEPDDVRTAIAELQLNKNFSGNHHLTFAPRREQADAILKTHEYFHSVWKEDMHATPRFLWNAKMRFGKTFATYQLAKKLPAKRVLVLTFKPAVEDAWKVDLESHVDFDGWQYCSKSTNSDPTKISANQPLVYFGSFQDLLGKDELGRIKAKNEWLHKVNWDLVVFDEYHFGAWRDSAKELFEGEDESEKKKEANLAYNPTLDEFHQEIGDLNANETEFLPLKTRAYLYLSGTPFRALSTGEFIEEQIYNWSYSDEQRAKQEYAKSNPGQWNPYDALPQMSLFTYQMPDELISIANQGEFNEFDLNTFFAASGTGKNAKFKNEDSVNKWLQVIRGEYAPTQVDQLKLGSEKPPFPYADVRLLPHLEHAFWFLPTVSSCQAMANLLEKPHNKFWHDYKVLVVAGTGAGIGLEALPPVKKAIGAGFDTKTITLSCGKLTTGVTVPQWSSILMLRNLKSPETYFQAAFRVQSSWSIKNPNGDDPQEEEIIKPICYVFDFAPTRALRQISEYALGLSNSDVKPEKAVQELINFLPVLAYDGAHMVQIDAEAILDTAMAGTSATLLARKWESALLVNVDNQTLSQVLADPKALEAIMKIEGFRKLGDKVLETIIVKSQNVKAKKKSEKDPKKKPEISAEEREYKALRKQVQEKLIKFATRIPAFMYLTDFRENKLQDVITKIDSGLFRTVTGLTVEDFDLLVSHNVFNASHMNQAVYAFRRYEDASLSYSGINAHEGLRSYGLFDTVVAKE